MAVGLSDAHGRPGLEAVRAWPVDVLVEALLVVEAADGMRRYDEMREIAARSLRQ